MPNQATEVTEGRKLLIEDNDKHSMNIIGNPKG